MQIEYKNKRLENILIIANALTSGMVVASFVLLFGGFKKELMPPDVILYTIQVVLLCIFVAEKIIRFSNSASKNDFWRANWFEIPLLLMLGITAIGAGRWFAPLEAEAVEVRHFAVGIYLVIQVVAKLCRTSVNMAASGKSPTQTLIISFLVLIISGAGLLMLPRASTGDNLSFVDALFTATSATCVTGLIVKDTGQDFSLMGQIVILTLIQLGGLGIVVFGAVFALLLGQALSLRDRVAMQDLLSAQTLSRIGNIIAFIFFGTIIIEAVGAVSLFGMWNDVPGRIENIEQQWFCSIFHSISAFCNAGFSLFKDSFISYDKSWGVYVVVCPLIILGGLGFGVLYDIVTTATDRVKRILKKLFFKRYRLSMETPKRLRLQTKIVLSVSACLIVLGMLAILVFERYASGTNSPEKTDILGALFQSITARTAGFNTVDISATSASSKVILILLMFIGGSPGSTAGGIKTVTLAVVVMTAIAALRKRQEVEMFKRSVRIVVVGRAVTVTLLFLVVLFTTTLALSITENSNDGFTMSDIMFEASSALGTVGLSTGITASLTTAGKFIIIATMLIGRLGPLTLLAALTFDLKPARYNYPDEAVIVG
ncbi:MAG: TrkH family potassium uptake protein [Sedimentisphaerales bacterium]|nr:TrkH family potassium uptake protein [Sedimentisphaerales bacterium]